MCIHVQRKARERLIFFLFFLHRFGIWNFRNVWYVCAKKQYAYCKLFVMTVGIWKACISERSKEKNKNRSSHCLDFHFRIDMTEELVYLLWLMNLRHNAEVTTVVGCSFLHSQTFNFNGRIFLINRFFPNLNEKLWIPGNVQQYLLNCNFQLKK